MNLGECSSSPVLPHGTCVEAEPGPEYRVTLSLTVRHAGALWDAAVHRALQLPGTRLDDVVEVIGPREDPSISDCLAMLVMPRTLPGCEAEDFWIDSLPGPCDPRELLHIS